MFTDIEDSTRLWEVHGDVMRDALACHNALLHQAIETNHGYVFKTVGDAFCAAFSTATEALNAAIAAQRELIERRSDKLSIRVRMALYTGSAIERDGDYFGPTLNRVARLMSAGHGGQILVSDTTHALLQKALSPEAVFQDCGIHRLRDVGQEHIWQVIHDRLDRDFPPLKTLDPERHNLPIPLTPLIGREAELASWHALLLQPTTRLLTLTGSAGIGKSRVALQLGELSIEDFPDGVWWIELQDAHTGEEMLQRLAYHLHLPPLPQPSIREQLAAFLYGGRRLLILDNTEQIPDAGSVVHELLSAAPETKCVVTSRRALELLTEQNEELPPLPGSDAERLFVERAQARKADFALNVQNGSDVVELCRRLEGIPLAIELAALRIVGMSPRDMLRRLGERFELLRSRAPDLPPRQRALDVAIAWSYDLLSPEDKSLYAQLSVFAGGFALTDAEAICAAPDVFEGVMELRRNSFFRTETDNVSQETRFLMLDSLRDYGVERLREMPEVEMRVRQRHAAYFRDYFRARLRSLRTPEEEAALQQMTVQVDNLRAAIAWEPHKERDGLRAELQLMLGIFLDRSGFHREATRPVQEALDAIQPYYETEPSLYAEILYERAGLHYEHREWQEARQCALEALALFEQTSDLLNQALASNLLGEITSREKDFGMARDYFARALLYSQQTGNTLYTAIVHNNLGLMEYRDKDGSDEQAAYHLQEALRLRRTVGDRRGLAETLTNLGILAFRKQEWEAAWRFYAEALENECALHHHFGVGRALANLGEVAIEQGDRNRAGRLLAAAERLLNEMKSQEAAFASDLLSRIAASGFGEESVQSLRISVRDQRSPDLVAWALERKATP